MPDPFNYFGEYRRLSESIADSLAAADEPALLARLARYRAAGIAGIPEIPADEVDVEILAYLSDSCYGLGGLSALADPPPAPLGHLHLFEKIRVPVPSWSQLRSAVDDARRVALEVLEEGKQFGLLGCIVWGCIASYSLLRLLKYPQWPHPSELEASDWHVLFDFTRSYVEGEDWPTQRTSHEAKEMKRCAVMDPALPVWVAKDENRPNPWLSDMGEPSDEKKTRWDQLLHHHIPAMAKGEGRLAQLLAGPVRDAREQPVYERALRRMTSHAAHLLIPLGVDEDPDKQDWRWAITLCLLAGLGRTALAAVAERMADSEADAGSYWSSVLDLLAGSPDAATAKRKVIEFDKLLDDARVMCGYPMALLRVPYPQLQSVAERTDTCPKGMAAALLLWLFLRVRVLPGDGGMRLLITGDQAQVVSPAVDPDVALSDGLNAKLVMPLLLTHLGIRRAPAAAERTALDGVIASVLKSLKPGHFITAVSVDEDPTMVPSTATSVHPAVQFERRLRLGEVGVEAGPVLQIDPVSGTVDHGHQILGLRVADTAFCLAPGIPVEKLARLPASLEPSTPFSVMRPALPQLDDLGHPGGLAALKDAVLLVSLLRRQLATAGTVGAMVQSEFPLLPFYPHTTKSDETQTFTLNADGDPTFRNGKTTVALQEARILSPGIEHNGFSRSGGGPALREQAASLRRFGHDVVDEYVFLKGEMLFSREALKELATGGSVSSGVYAGNGTAPRLRHPLFLSAKLPDAAAELTSRTLPTFYRQITTEIMAGVSDTLRDRYLAGDLSLEARLRGLLWASREGLIGAVAQLPLARSDVFRFAGHLSVAYWIADRVGTPRTEVDAYLTAAGVRCSDLRRDGQSVAEEIGATSACDPRFFLAQMPASEAARLCDAAIAQGCLLKPLELALYLVGHGDARTLKARLGRTSEKRFLADLRLSVQAGEFANEFLRIDAVPDPRRARSENRVVYQVHRTDHDERYRSLKNPRSAFVPTAPAVPASAHPLATE